MSYNYCLCAFPKRLKNSAHGEDFYVCAKSLDGCGKEIGKELSAADLGEAMKKSKVMSGTKAKIFINGQPVGFADVSYSPSKSTTTFKDDCPDCGGTGARLKWTFQGYIEEECNCN